MNLRRTTLSGALCALGAAALLAACGADGTEDTECDPSDRFCVDDGRRGGPDRGTVDAGPERLRPDGGVGWCDIRSCDEIAAAGASLNDADEDGVPDCAEGDSDPDGDGIDACLDDDSDGDGILDADEGMEDTDDDGVINLLDTDSDDDNITDAVEGIGRNGEILDDDEDGVPNYLDLDSDDDGWPDAAEYGRDPGSDMPPVDRDGDGTPDYRDLDSDGDGLGDEFERGCPDSTDRTRRDTDGDGFHDLVEFAFGSDACDSEDTIEGIVDFYFELPYGDPAQSDTLEFGTDISLGDVVFNMDTTGSMGNQIDELKDTLSDTLIPALDDRISGVGVGVSRFDDFPCEGFGGGGDVPFELLQRVTTNAGDAQRGVDALTLHNGGDGPESGFEALYQLATGSGRPASECGGVEPFDPAEGLRAGSAEGLIGGAGFRSGALPIIVHITDARSHAKNDDDGYPFGATRDETYAALRAAGAKVVGVTVRGWFDESTPSRPDAEDLAVTTGARVPACAWDDPRPRGCFAEMCCTGTNGEGRGRDTDGLCPLVFDVDNTGEGLDTSIVSGIDALIRFAPMDVTAVARRDPAEPIIDTSCFIQSVIPDVALPRAGTCVNTNPERVDFDGDSVLDGFADVTPGTQLQFTITARNDCVPPREEPQVFLAYIDVVGDGTAVLDTQLVTILVPPSIKN